MAYPKRLRLPVDGPEPAPPPAYRAQCSSCMRVTDNPTAKACPACGSRRLVVLAGRAARPPKAAPPTPALAAAAPTAVRRRIAPVHETPTPVHREGRPVPRPAPSVQESAPAVQPAPPCQPAAPIGSIAELFFTSLDRLSAERPDLVRRTVRDGRVILSAQLPAHG